MKIGRESGRYVPFRTVSSDGATGPAPLAGITIVDGHQFQLVVVSFVIGQPHVAQRILVAGDALDQHVVVLTGRVIAAADFGLAVDDFGKVVERARIHARAEQMNFLVRPVRPHLIPAKDLSLRRRIPHFLELCDRD